MNPRGLYQGFLHRCNTSGTTHALNRNALLGVIIGIHGIFLSIDNNSLILQGVQLSTTKYN
jgi:hypothetical protein